VISRYPAAEFEPARYEIVAALDKLNELRARIATLAPKAQ
jgi:hypothetical protein